MPPRPQQPQQPAVPVAPAGPPAPPGFLPGDRPLSFEDLVRTEATRQRVPPELALAIARQESQFNPWARSKKGAMGLMQLMPETAAKYKLTDPYEPLANIRAGMQEFRSLLDKYDVETALAAYNAGEGAVQQAGGKVPPYRETQEYIQRIMAEAQPIFQAQVGKGGGGTPQTPTPMSATVTPPTSTPIATPPPAPKYQLGPAPHEGFQMSRAVLPAAGALVGGVRGAAMGARAGAVFGAPAALAAGFLGGIAGAGVGAFGGEGAQIGVEQTGRALGAEGIPPATTEGVVSRLGESTQTAMRGQAWAETLGPLATTLGRPFRGSLSPYAKEAAETFRSPKTGQPLVLPSEISKSRVLSTVQNATGSSLLGGGKAAEIQASRQALAEQKVHKTLNSLGPFTTGKEAGEGAVAARDVAIKRFREEQTKHYDAFAKLAQDIPMTEAPKFEAFARGVEQTEAGGILPHAGRRAASDVVDVLHPPPPPKTKEATEMIGGRRVPVSQIQPAIREAMGMLPPESGVATLEAMEAGTLTAAQFQKTVRDLGTLKRQLERAAAIDPNKNAQLGMVKKLSALAREDLTDTLAASNPQALEAFETAQAFSKFGNRQLFNDEILKAVKQAPEQIVPSLLTTNNSTAIGAVREAVGPKAFGDVQAAAMRDLLKADAKTDSIRWDKLLTKLDKLGDDTTSALFPDGHAKDVQRVAKLMVELDRKPGGNKGQIVTAMIQASGLMGMATGVMKGSLATTTASAATLMAPAVLSRALASPTATKWLLTGLKAPRGSREAAQAWLHLVNFTNRAQDQTAADRQAGAPPPGGLIATPPPGPRR